MKTGLLGLVLLLTGCATANPWHPVTRVCIDESAPEVKAPVRGDNAFSVTAWSSYGATEVIVEPSLRSARDEKRRAEVATLMCGLLDWARTELRR